MNFTECRTAVFKNFLNDILFESYKTTSDWQKYVKDKAYEYIDKCSDWFFFGGQPGCGKTHICTAIVGALLKKGKAPKYMLWQDDITKIKQASSNLEVYEALINSYKQAEIFYIDDFFLKLAGAILSQQLMSMLHLRLSITDTMKDCRLS